MIEPRVPYEIRKAIEAQAEHLADVLVESIVNKELNSVDECRDFLHDMHVEDTLAINLTLDRRMETIDWFAEDHGFTLEDVNLSNLRLRIEGLACVLIHYEACAVVDEFIENLEELMNDEEFDFSDIRPRKYFNWARHHGTRNVDSHCNVYEYRNVEGTHVDVYVFHGLDTEICFHKSIDVDGLTDEEKYFDAS